MKLKYHTCPVHGKERCGQTPESRRITTFHKCSKNNQDYERWNRALSGWHEDEDIIVVDINDQ